nr:unnamed protein product [Callosobruchus analis]
MHRINVPTDNCVKYYQISIFLPWLDSFLSNLKERFSKHKMILSNLMVLLPSGNFTTQKQLDDFHALLSFYHQDVAELSRNVLDAELRLWYQKSMKIDGSSVEPPATPKCAIDALNACNAAIYPNIFTNFAEQTKEENYVYNRCVNLRSSLKTMIMKNWPKYLERLISFLITKNHVKEKGVLSILERVRNGDFHKDTDKEKKRKFC